MAARQVIVPGAMPSRDANGRSLPAKLRFYEVDTALSTPATVYTTSALSVAHAFPILSDAAGRWPQIWCDEADVFDVGWTDQVADQVIATFSDIRPLDDGVLSSVSLAQAYADEAAASALAAAASAANVDTISTSSSTVTIGDDPAVFELDQTGKAYAIGQEVVAAKTGSPTDNISGTVIDFSDPILTISPNDTQGSGSGSAWIISQVPQGNVQTVAGLFGPAIDAEDLKTALALDYGDIYDALGYAPSGTITEGLVTGRISNTPSYETTRITFSAGQSRDSTNVADIVLSTPISKDLTATWAAGTGNGGRDAATALAAGQTWHCHVILDVDTGTEDALFSLSPTAPTLPAGYDYFRRWGSIILDASATTIQLFYQTDDWFMLKTRSADFAAQANGSGPYYRVVNVPDGIRVLGKFYLQSAGTATATTFLSLVWDPIFGAPPAFGGAAQWAQVTRIGVRDYNNAGAISSAKAVCDVFTDTTKHVYTFASDSSDLLALGVLGWQDKRSLT